MESTHLLFLRFHGVLCVWDFFGLRRCWGTLTIYHTPLTIYIYRRRWCALQYTLTGSRLSFTLAQFESHYPFLLLPISLVLFCVFWFVVNEIRVLLKPNCVHLAM
ncbi:hypothetical protein EJ02DRAFT_20945 [Clathrospora elynae]|uniref:Uncharacterized protein n=1 Tax=Clathrospora elynae TaxID=706981 RepID=A0A6A5SD48_9PLEO|nr:hypothetical protein EJ02DRAFT_20945 [Clathrospora elynae]